MRNIFLLTRLLLKNGQGKQSSEKGENQKRGSRAILYGVLLICLLPVAVLLFHLGEEIHGFLAPAGMETVFMELVFFIASLCIFFFSLSTVMSVFYLSSDVEALLPLPLRPWEIVGTKFLICLLYEYWIVLLLVLPLLLGFGTAGGLGAPYWVCAVLGCIGLPLVPLVYASVLMMLILRVFKNIRNKDFLSYAGYVLALVLTIGLNMAARNVDEIQVEDVQNFLGGSGGMFSVFRILLPNIRFLGEGVQERDPLSMAVFYLISAAFLAVCFLLAQKLYLPVVLGMGESGSKKKKMTAREMEKTVRRRKASVTFGWIEWKKLYRTPAYFMNCVLVGLLWPVLILVLGGISAGTSGDGGELAELAGALLSGQLRPLLSGDPAVAVAVLASGCFAGFLSLMCQVSSTAVSRQGRNFNFLKCIPLSWEKQIRGLSASGIFVGLLGSLPYVLILNTAAVLFGLPPVTLVYSALMTILFVLFVNYQQLFFDILWPKLEWENETAAVKQNYRALLSMLLDAAVAAALIGAGYFGFRVLGIDIHLVTCVLLAVLAALTGIMRHILYTRGAAALSEIEI